MRLSCLFVAIFLAAGHAETVTIVPYVQVMAGAGNFAAAENALKQYRAAAGLTPAYIEAFSWIGRAQLAKHNLAAAEQNSAEVRKMCAAELARHKLDAEPHLPIA